MTITAERTAQLATLAHQIINEGITIPCGMISLYDGADWATAAEYAIDGDFDDLDYMLRRDEALEAFHDSCHPDADLLEEFDDLEARRAA